MPETEGIKSNLTNGNISDQIAAPDVCGTRIGVSGVARGATRGVTRVWQGRDKGVARG